MQIAIWWIVWLQVLQENKLVCDSVQLFWSSESSIKHINAMCMTSFICQLLVFSRITQLQSTEVFIPTSTIQKQSRHWQSTIHSILKFPDTVCYSSSNSLSLVLKVGTNRDKDFQEVQHLLHLKQQFLMLIVKTAFINDLQQVLPVYYQLGIHILLFRLSDICAACVENTF